MVVTPKHHNRCISGSQAHRQRIQLLYGLYGPYFLQSRSYKDRTVHDFLEKSKIWTVPSILDSATASIWTGRSIIDLVTDPIWIVQAISDLFTPVHVLYGPYSPLLSCTITAIWPISCIIDLSYTSYKDGTVPY